MYPTIRQDSGPQQRPGNSQQQQQQYPGFGTAIQRVSPAPNGDLPSSGATPSLRVHIAERYRTSPPVLISQDLLQPPGSSAGAPSDFGLDLERSVLAEGEERAPPPKAPDAWSARADRFRQLGFSREVVGLALAGCADSPGDDSKVASWCEHLKELKAMGFPGPKAFGALALHNGNMEAASNACLN